MSHPVAPSLARRGIGGGFLKIVILKFGAKSFSRGGAAIPTDQSLSRNDATTQRNYLF